MDTTPYEKKDAAPVAEVVATPAAEAHAEKVGVDLSEVEGSGKDGTVVKADVVAAAASAEVLNDCGHGGPGWSAMSGYDLVRHCGKCAGMTGY